MNIFDADEDRAIVGCDEYNINEVQASTTARFCMLRKMPSDWTGTPLFRHLQAESEKKGKTNE